MRGQLMESGSAGVDYLLHDRDGWHPKQEPITPFGFGMFGVWEPDPNNPRGPGSSNSDSDDVVSVSTSLDDLLGHYNYFLLPQNPAKTPTPRRDGPCVGVKVSDLDYSKVTDYYKGFHLVTESARDHILKNHIDGRPGKSRYETDPPQDREPMFLQVQFYNAVTFGLGTQVNTLNKRVTWQESHLYFSFHRYLITLSIKREGKDG
jgi:hypothetical protein